MPGRYPRRRVSSLKGIVNSTKNEKFTDGATGTTRTQVIVSNAIDAPTTAVSNTVRRGCMIKAIWLSIDVCGLAASGVLQTTSFYFMLNPGSNLTPPNPRTEGTSNEKKYIFKTWNAMTMRNQDGNTPYHWEGWIKIPKKYQRQGIDDQFQLQFITTTAAGHFATFALYKWYI